MSIIERCLSTDAILGCDRILGAGKLERQKKEAVGIKGLKAAPAKTYPTLWPEDELGDEAASLRIFWSAARQSSGGGRHRPLAKEIR